MSWFVSGKPEALFVSLVSCVPVLPCHQDVVELFYKQLYPNCFADYCFRVAVKFSDFFRDCRVMGSPEQTSRLLLCLCVQTALRTVFHLLGIDPVDRV